MSSADGPSKAAPAALIIDDEDYVADMIAAALELEGYQVMVAYNGREGLELAKSAVVQVIIVDIMMPYLSGLELVEQLRATKQGGDVPIVLISAGARPRKTLSNVVFLPKPFEIEELLRLVEAHVRQL